MLATDWLSFDDRTGRFFDRQIQVNPLMAYQFAKSTSIAPTSSWLSTTNNSGIGVSGMPIIIRSKRRQVEWADGAVFITEGKGCI